MAALSYDLGRCCNYEKQRFGATTKKAGKQRRTQKERRKEEIGGRNEEEVRDRQQWAMFVVGELQNFPMR